MTHSTYRIALLLCDVPLPPVQEKFGDYGRIFTDWLEASLLTCPHTDAPNVRLSIKAFDVVNKHELPSYDALAQKAEFDAVVITGSRHTAHEDSPDFIPKLAEWIKYVCNEPSMTHVKMLGICFGHQIIARALGGRCERGQQGWELGVHAVRLSAEGERWFQGSKNSNSIYLEQMHRDHVSSLPPGFITTMSTPRYPIHGMVKYHPASTEEQPAAQVMTLQGHPEFVPELVDMMVRYRGEAGIIDSDTMKEGLRRVPGKAGQGGEGFENVGWAIWGMLLGVSP